MANGWKITAIIFIILFAASVFFMIWAYKEGSDYIKQEEKCIYDICGRFESYLYDDSVSMCYCFEDGEIVKEEYIG